jgi:hypothetical protein
VPPGLGLRGFCVQDPELAAELTNHEPRFQPPTISRDATCGLTQTHGFYMGWVTGWVWVGPKQMGVGSGLPQTRTQSANYRPGPITAPLLVNCLPLAKNTTATQALGVLPVVRQEILRPGKAFQIGRSSNEEAWLGQESGPEQTGTN